MPVFGKDMLCSSLRSVICDEQGIGKYPLWQRYDLLSNVIRKHIPNQYQGFLAHPERVVDMGTENILWYGDRAQSSQPCALTELTGEEREKYVQIKNNTIAAYQTAIQKCRAAGESSDAEFLEKSLKHVGEFDDFFYCYDDKVVVVVWGMRPRDVYSPKRAIVDKVVNPNISYIARFDLKGLGTTNSNIVVRKRPQDTPIQPDQVPLVTPLDGYKFIGWDEDPVGYKLTSNKTFVAQYEEEKKPASVTTIPPESGLGSPASPGPGSVAPDPKVFHTVRFEDEDGTLLKQIEVEHGSIIDSSLIPPIPERKNYKCSGWGSGVQEPIEHDTTFRLSYERLPLSWWERLKAWFSRLWLWFRGAGCLKWLLRVLLLLLLLLLILLLLRHCTPRKSKSDSWANPIYPVCPDDPNRGDGSEQLPYEPINPEDPGFEFLPEEPGKPLPIDEGDAIPDEDSLRSIVKNRLNVLIDAEDITITDFAYDFKQAYPAEEYEIIYADPVVKRLQLKVPENERVKIKGELVSKLPDKYQGDKIFVWDEALMVGSYVPNDEKIESCWYHKAIKTFAGWDITMGSEDIIVAIIDDGFNIHHKEFEGRVLTPYNVYTKTNVVEESQFKHGSHVAGLSVAAADNGIGIAGVAPKCKFLPIQVFDKNGYCSTNATVDGVLYAIYKGADVVNLSLGLQLSANIPVQDQRALIAGYFKEEERLWKKVFSMANRNNTAIVIAAGNENLLAGIDPMHRSEDVIVVAAVDRDYSPLQKADFSNFGAYTDVSAPGCGILSTTGRNGYEIMSGTSMAAPIVSGAVALIKSVNRPLSTKKIKKILRETGLQVNGDIGPLIQLDKAILRAKDENPDSEDTIPTPTQGALQVLLEWNDYNDLDLLCTDPNGDMVWYKNKVVPSGGQLEIDMNAGGMKSSHPIENIYWPTGGAPVGDYEVRVLYYKRHDELSDNSKFKVTVRYAEQELHYEGHAITEGATYEVGKFSFTMN